MRKMNDGDGYNRGGSLCVECECCGRVMFHDDDCSCNGTTDESDKSINYLIEMNGGCPNGKCKG